MQFDPSRVEVNGKVELEDPQGRIREVTACVVTWAASGCRPPSTASRTSRLAVVTGTTLTYQSGHVVVNGKRLNEAKYVEPAT